jgi:hypothetical protein
MIEAVASDMAKDGITLGTVIVPDYVESRPVTIDRPSWRVLEDISHQHDLIWMIQDGTLNIYPADKPLRDKPLVLTESTGVLDAPEFTHDGVSLRTMMLHFLRPGYTFILQNKQVTSRAPEKYRVEEINFTGSSVGDDFGATIEAKVITANGKVKRSRDRGKGRKP